MHKLSEYSAGKLPRGTRVRINGRLGTVVQPHEPNWIDHKTKAYMVRLQGADIGFDDEQRPFSTYAHIDTIEVLSEADECTHEIVEYGCCAGCGTVLDSMWLEAAYPHMTPAELNGCQGRGWYHDGSEEEDAIRSGRTPKPCPYCK